MKKNIRKIKFNISKFIEKYSSLKIAGTIFIIFLAFYIKQIPDYTSNADVIIYSLRSIEQQPILEYAFHDITELTSEAHLPNYHIGHTVILWAFYQLFPEFTANSIWPAGFLSAISMALALAVGFLLFIELGLKKKDAVLISILAGIIPSIWYHALIGEVYAIQFLMIIVFYYFFLKKNLLFATLFFLLSVLISPVSALAFSGVFYTGWRWSTIKRAFVVGLASLVIYLAIFQVLSIDILGAAKPLESSNVGKSYINMIMKFGMLIGLNFSFLLLYLPRGGAAFWRSHRDVCLRHALAIGPQFILVVLSPNFTAEYGAFFLLLFWGISPIIYFGFLSAENRVLKRISIFIMIIMFVGIWAVSARTFGQARHAAGIWLKNNVQEDVRMIGDWYSGVGITTARFGWDLDHVNSTYYESEYVADLQLMETGENRMIIVIQKRPIWRQWLSKLPVEQLQIYQPQFDKTIKSGTVKHVFENQAVNLYVWEKKQEMQ